MYRRTAIICYILCGFVLFLLAKRSKMLMFILSFCILTDNKFPFILLSFNIFIYLQPISLR